MLELSKLPNTADNAAPHMLRYGDVFSNKLYIVHLHTPQSDSIDSIDHGGVFGHQLGFLPPIRSSLTSRPV